MNDFQLSEHFKFSELVVTNVRQYTSINAAKAEQYIDSLKKVCADLLEPIHAQFGSIKVDSGFRCAELNLAIGGSTTSEHVEGHAADIIQIAKPDYDGCVEIWKWAKDNLNYHQLLLEHLALHISLPRGVNDMQAKFAVPDPQQINKWILTDFKG